MANELSLTLKFRFERDDEILEKEFIRQSFNVAGSNALMNYQTVGTAEEALVLGDAGAGGYLLMWNTDATNYVEIRPATGIADLVRLLAGDVALFRITNDATAPFVIANTASVRIGYILLPL